MKNKKRVAVLEKLLKVLKGRCSKELESCPSEIYANMFLADDKKYKNMVWYNKGLPTKMWSCDTCTSKFLKMDEEAFKKYQLVTASNTNKNPCPCVYLDFTTCEARIKEMIEECGGKP